jgi:hypothetical protein
MASRTIFKVITTVSITHCWKSRLLGGLGTRLERAARLSLGCVLLAVAFGTAAQPSGAEISQLRLERAEDGVLLSAAVRFELPQIIEDALLKGIPMFFVAEAVLLRDRWYWYDKQVASTQRHMRLSYQPLTRRWRLLVSSSQIGNSGLALGQNFETREEALAAVQRISRWKIADTAEVEAEARYNVDFRFRLDLSQLPRPFQIGAVGQADWTINVARNQRLTLESAP